MIGDQTYTAVAAVAAAIAWWEAELERLESEAAALSARAVDEADLALKRRMAGRADDRRIANCVRNSVAGVYIFWLAYRLHSLGKTTPVSWPAIHAQFGAGFKAIRQMKPVFVEALT